MVGAAGITYAAADDAVITFGAYGNVGPRFRGIGTSQVAFDKRGEVELQATAGYGLSTGVDKSIGGVVSVFPNMENVSQSREYSSTIGISVGIGFVIGLDILYAGEGSEIHPVGFSFSYGPGNAIEIHCNNVYTWKIPEWEDMAIDIQKCIDMCLE